MAAIQATQPLKLSGDPRRPQEVRNFVPPVIPEDTPGDFRLVGSMLFGLASMLTKVPWFGWVGILLNLNYFANMKSSEFDLKSCMSAVFFSISGLVGAYITNLRPLGT